MKIVIILYIINKMINQNYRCLHKEQTNSYINDRYLDTNSYPIKLDPLRYDPREEYNLCGNNGKYYCDKNTKKNISYKLESNDINFSRPINGKELPNKYHHIDTESYLYDLNKPYSKCNIQFQIYTHSLPMHYYDDNFNIFDRKPFYNLTKSKNCFQ